MKKVGILTFQNCINIGANLQAYALNKYLSINEYNTETIDLIDISSQCHIIGSFLWTVKNMKNNIYKPLRILKLLFSKKNLLAILIFKNFSKKYIIQSNSVNSYKDINKLNYNTVILGSDQIWNSNNDFGLNKIFWGKNLNSKIISYAASMGKDRYIESEEKQANELIKNISVISMREESNAKYLSKLTGRDIKVVCDPVFLLDKSDYSELAEKSKFKSKNKFIFIYNLNNSSYLKEVANNLNKNKEYKIYEVKRNTKLNNYKFIGPVEFLYLINNADYILTDSFHGTSLSIIMEKEFYTYISPFGASRLHNILEKSGLTDREINENKKMELNKINYSKVKEKLNSFIEYSKNYLKENI